MATITIQKGDTLSLYAKKYNVSVEDIVKANNLSDKDKIKVGQKIEIPLVNETNNTDVDIKKTQKQEKEKKFLDIINKHLNIPNYQTSVIEKDETKFLRLYRPIDDEYQPEKRHSMDLDSIKSNLLIEDGIIQKYNDMVRVTNSRCWDDDNTIDPGQTLDIPVSAIGKKKGILGLFESDKNKELKQAVKDLSN